MIHRLGGKRMKTALIIFVALLTFSPLAKAEVGAKERLQNFYAAYLKHDADLAGKSRTLKEAEKDEKKLLTPWLTPDFLRQISLRKKTCGKLKEPTADCDGDFFYCAQEAPTSFTVGSVKELNHAAAGEVTLCFACETPQAEKRKVSVGLKQLGRGWKISSVKCPK